MNMIGLANTKKQEECHQSDMCFAILCVAVYLLLNGFLFKIWMLQTLDGRRSFIWVQVQHLLKKNSENNHRIELLSTISVDSLRLQTHHQQIIRVFVQFRAQIDWTFPQAMIKFFTWHRYVTRPLMLVWCTG